MLRDLFVFKLVPMLNPDGVKRGHYRTDIFGVNLNRSYQNPDIFRQPTIFAIKTLMMYHHFARTDPKIGITNLKSSASEEASKVVQAELCVRKCHTDTFLPKQIQKQYEDAKEEVFSSCETVNDISEEKEIEVENYTFIDSDDSSPSQSSEVINDEKTKFVFETKPLKTDSSIDSYNDDGVFIYIDLHGHASKRGCFIYGNHFEKEKEMVECMLLPKLISINSSHFDFQACNFTEKNMYHKDKKDGLSKEGSGRVSMFKALGIVHR